ncbi:hypothetical protein V3C33_01475 [Micrococcaceae bacterium Sec5.7]
MKYRTRFGVAAAIALTLASCTATPQSEAPIQSASPKAAPEMPIDLVVSAGGKKAVVHSGPSSAPEFKGRLTGSLLSDGAGCITVRAQDGDTRTLVFPEGTTFKGESVALPDGSSVSDGTTVVLDGASVPANEDVSMCLNYGRLFSVEKASVQPQ